MDVNGYLNDRKALVDAWLRRCFADENPLFPVMYYSLDQGKRIRPILAMASYEACGGKNGDDIMPVACALELIHTYSLIHDDLPAMDNDDLRRGKPSAHRKFGEGVAILSGDGLFAHAFSLLANGDAACEARYRSIRAIARAVGPRGIVFGQMLDIGPVTCDPRTLRQIHSNKTAKFIAVSLEVGALMAEATEKVVRALYWCGLLMGMLFQYTDDILDVTGAAQELGKTPGKDKIADKVTAPAVYGLAGARFRAQRYADRAQAGFRALGDSFAVFPELTDYILNRTH